MAAAVLSLSNKVSKCEGGLIAGSIQFEYDPDELATKIATRLVHKSNSKTYV